MQDNDTPIDRGTLARRWERAEEERATLLRLARSRGLSPQDAEDCVHEAMLRVVPRPDLDEERMGALLTTVVIRSAIDQHRRAKTTNRVVARAGAIITALHDGDPATTVCDRDEARWTAGLVDRLPETQRQALLARADGRPVNDIARDMSTTAKAIESLISRARNATRQAMASGLSAVVGFARRFSQLDPGATAAAGAVVVALALPSTFHHHDGSAQAQAAAEPRPAGATIASAARSDTPASQALTKNVASMGAPTTHSGSGTGTTASAGPTPRETRVEFTTPAPGGGTSTFQGSVEDTDQYEAPEDKIERCRTYGPTLDMDEDDPSILRRHSDDPCRYDHGSPIWS